MSKPIYGDTVGGGGGSLKKIPQSDWNQTDETQLDYIKNKPAVYTQDEVDAKKLDKIADAVGYYRVYAIDDSGVQDTIGVDWDVECKEGNIPVRNPNLSIYIPNPPQEDTDATNKYYVDDLVGDIDTALDEILEIQNNLIESGTSFDIDDYCTEDEVDEKIANEMTQTIGDLSSILTQLNEGGIV